MAQAAPETIFNDLMERAVAVLRGARMSDLELRRFEKDVALLERVDLPGMFELRAYIAEMKGDSAEMHSMFQRALQLSRDYVGTVVRYLVLLSGAARTDDLIRVYREYEGALQGDIGALRSAERALVFAGWCETASHLTSQLERLGAEPIKADKPQGLRYPVHLDKGDLEESDIAHLVGFVQRYLMSKASRAQTVQTVALPTEDGSSHLLVQMQLDESPARVAELEWELFERLDEADLAADRQGFARVILASRQAEIHHADCA